MRQQANEWGAIAVLTLLTTVGIFGLADLAAAPFEDAAMLMRYARHFGQGHGLVWNLGEPPVDGATDFLPTVLLGGLVALGFPLEGATRGLCLVCHVASIALVYLLLRRQGAGPRIACAAAGYVALGPGAHYCAAYFVTPVFALAALAAWGLAREICAEETPSPRLQFAFAGLALVTGLVRPEGVILACLLLLTILLDRGPRVAWPVAVRFGLVFGLLGGAYFLWRWRYFGHPLPNPFYKKGGGSLHLDGLEDSVRNVVRLLWPFLPIYVAAIRSPETWRLALRTLVPIVGFAGAFVLLSSEMNYAARFQYALLPIGAVGWYACVRSDLERFLERLAAWNFRERLALALNVAAAALVAVYLVMQVGRRARYHDDGRLAAARILHEFRGTSAGGPENRELSAAGTNPPAAENREIAAAGTNPPAGTNLPVVNSPAAENREIGGQAPRGPVLATTEAGLLPLYSGWHAIDVWGLNDAWIAHHGGVTAEYLDRTPPDVILIHSFFSPGSPPQPGRAADPWERMTLVVRDYALARGYETAAIYCERPDDVHWYFVRRDFPHRAELVRRLREIPYVWSESGRVARDFR